jgi:hypothetical protein
MVLGICPEQCSTIIPLRKSKIADPPENLPPSAHLMARDWKLIGILIGAAPDCRPQPAGTSPTLGWSEIVVKLRGRGEVQKGGTVVKSLTYH